MRRGERSSHPFAVVVLLVLAALAGALAIAAIWANQQLLDTRGWVAASDRVLASEEVRQRVAGFLAEELVAEAEGRLSAAGQRELAAAVVPQLRQRGPALAAQVVATPRFRAVWLRANREAHRALVPLLEDERGSGEGPVVINLTPALRELADSASRTELAARIGVTDLGSLIEPGAARIEVLEANELRRAQGAVWAIRSLPVPATIAAAVLLALAILLGRARPSRTFVGVGLSLAAAGGLALAVRALAGHELVAALLDGRADRDAAEAAWRIATSTVSDLAVGAICLGGLVAVWAVLAGDSALGIGCRRRLAPLVRTPLARLWMLLIAILLFLLLIAWAPIAALEAPLGIALFAAAFLGGAAAVGREAGLEETPAARSADWG